MAFVKNFDKSLHINKDSAKSDYNAWDNPAVKARGNSSDAFFKEHLKQYSDLISWAR